MTEPMIAWVNGLLGPSSVVGTPPATGRREGTSQCVVEVLDGHGHRWFAKRAATPAGWRAEVRAYRRWVPALGSHAPTLHAANRDLRTLLISRVPGTQPAPSDPLVHRQAGVLLRRLHEANPARRQHPRARLVASRRLSRLLSAQPRLLTPTEAMFVEDQMRIIEALPLAPIVPCHGDYKAHNWLVDDAETLRIIDFGNSFRGTAAFDFSKLFYGAWWKRPHLAEHFFEGYGRDPTDHELAFAQSRLALYAVADIEFGRRQHRSRDETQGRARLADLMAGHQIRARQSPLDRARRLYASWRRGTLR